MKNGDSFTFKDINMSFKILSSVHAVLLSLTLVISACSKLIEVAPPTTSITDKSIFQSDETAIAMLTGIYSKMSNSSFQQDDYPPTSFYWGLSSDEFTLHGNASSNITYTQFYTNSLTDQTNEFYWFNFYNTIYMANAAIEGLNQSKTLTPKVKQQLIGESLFMRAFCYFYLTNLYGDVPLALTTDYVTNRQLGRSIPTLVYQQIINDLKEAKELLSSEYLASTLLKTTSERIRPNKWVASALLSRAYLYSNDYRNAEIEASTVINNRSLYNLSQLEEVFLKNSQEAIWQLQGVTLGWNTKDARLFIIPATGPDLDHPIYLSTALLNNIESGDNRGAQWIGEYIDTTTTPFITYHYPYKYKNGTLDNPTTEYEMVLRLAEQYLIRAEARTKLGKLNEANEDIDIIRIRAGLKGTIATTQSELLDAILHERQIELFSEWGHRWFDLKRTERADKVMGQWTSIKGGTWSNYKQFYPLPLNEIKNAPNIKQNQGY